MILKVQASMKPKVAAKGPEFYKWREYTSGNSVSFVTTGGKRPVTLAKGVIYGVRKSRDGKKKRLVVKQAKVERWINIVYTIDEKAYARITDEKYSKEIPQPSMAPVTAKNKKTSAKVK